MLIDLKTIAVAALIFACLGAAGGSAVAESVRSPVGFKLFCAKNPDQCRASSQGSVVMTDEIMKSLKRVNSAVNRKIQPRADRGIDVWTVEASYGDCEDYVITKRSRLIREGFPAGALRLVFAKTRRGENHAVLLVRTDRGDFVLDNLANSIKPTSQSGLRFISMSTSNPKKWVAL
jgi:predicted transglutaminase-like cysteine proteinase